MAVGPNKRSSIDEKENIETIETKEHNFSSDTEAALPEEDGKITFKTKMAVLVRCLLPS